MLHQRLTIRRPTSFFLEIRGMMKRASIYRKQLNIFKKKPKQDAEITKVLNFKRKIHHLGQFIIFLAVGRAAHAQRSANDTGF